MRRVLKSMLLFTFMLTIIANAHAVRYRIVDLGTLGGNVSRAASINNNGQIVGTSSIAIGGDMHAFIWQNGVMQDMGTLGGNWSEANDINDTGQVVGSTLTPSNKKRAFIWESGSSMRDLGALGGITSEAKSINNSGQVVGWASTASNTFHAFIWKSGSSMKDLGTTGYESQAMSINNNSQIAGWSRITGSNETHTFIWQDGFPTQDLGTFTGRSSDAYAINDQKQVAGRITTPEGLTHAFFWQDGVLQNLGTLGGGNCLAIALNNIGQVAGFSTITGNAEDHAFVWQNGILQDLGTLGGGLTSVANGINDKGEIVGYSFASGACHAVLWQPIPETDPCVTISSPTTGPEYTTYFPTIDISGNATSTAGLRSVTWMNDRGGSGTCTSTSSWSVKGIILQPGDNILTITATDLSNISQTTTLKITRLLSVPELSIQSPAYAGTTYETYSTSLPYLAGTVNDINGIASITWSNDRGGSGDCSMVMSWWSVYDIPLQPGSNIITVTAINKIGVSETSKLTVIYTPYVAIGAAKNLPPNSLVPITDAVVTAVGQEEGTAFIESLDRSAGIKLLTNKELIVGQKVSLKGNVSKVDGEYQISVSTYLYVSDFGIDYPIYLKPLHLTSNTIGNDKTETLNYAGLNTTGLLVSLAGKVTSVDSSQRIIYVDDGCSYQDGIGSTFGIRVYVPASVTLPAKDNFVFVSGISRVKKNTLTEPSVVNGQSYPAGSTIYVPSIWVRNSGDLKKY